MEPVDSLQIRFLGGIVITFLVVEGTQRLWTCLLNKVLLTHYFRKVDVNWCKPQSFKTTLFTLLQYQIENLLIISAKLHCVFHDLS